MGLRLKSEYAFSVPMCFVPAIINDDFSGDFSDSDIKAIKLFMDDLPKHCFFEVEHNHHFFDKFHDLKDYGILPAVCQWINVSEYTTDIEA